MLKFIVLRSDFSVGRLQRFPLLVFQITGFSMTLQFEFMKFPIGCCLRWLVAKCNQDQTKAMFSEVSGPIALEGSGGSCVIMAT